MEKQLLEIKGYYIEGDSKDFIESKSWTGHILLSEDLSFEGIVVDATSDDDRLIAGTLCDYQGISLLKFNLKGFDPCAFYGVSDGEEIIGMFDAITPFRNILCGRSKIVLTALESELELKSSLEEKIKNFKSQMDEFNRYLYDGLIENMEVTVNEFLENLKHVKEEIEELDNIKVKKLVIKGLDDNN